jgi:diguanylate cyclase (GGDEF)-like protein
MAVTVNAQTRFDNSMVARGLPIKQVGAVNRIIQDKRGFIWIAGENGLGRYDGVSLQVYRREANNLKSLPNNYVSGIALDSHGTVWVGTQGGLCKYDVESESFERIDKIANQSLPRESITSLRAYENTLYVGTTAGLTTIDLTKQQILNYSSRLGNETSDNNVNDVVVDQQGDIWAATTLGGLARLEKSAGKLRYFTPELKNKTSTVHNHFRRLYNNAKGQLIVGTHGNGTLVFDKASSQFSEVKYPQHLGDSARGVVMDILMDHQGFYWIAVDQHGLIKLDDNFNFVEQFSHSPGDSRSLLSNQTRALLEDSNNDIWIGMLPFDISFLDRSKEAIHTYRSNGSNPATLSHSAILDFSLDSKGIVWIGTEGGLNSLNPTTGNIKRYVSNLADINALSANAVLSVVEDPSEDLWVGTWSGGLNRLNVKTGKFKRYPYGQANPNHIGDAFVWKIFRDKENNIWVGSETGGLQFYQPTTDDFGHYRHEPNNLKSISANYINDITQSDDGKLWIATLKGLNVFDPISKQFDVFNPFEKKTGAIFHEPFFCLHKDSRGFIWAGGYDNAVLKIDPRTRNAKKISIQNGNQLYSVSFIQEDAEGKIWLGTDAGLIRMNPDDFSMEFINVEQGLAGSIYNRNAALVTPSGELYFGSTEGVTRFKPKDLRSEAGKYPLYLTQFKIFNSDVAINTKSSPLKASIALTDSLELKHDDKMFSFSFVMLNYRNPELNNYAYKLDGFDREWIYVGDKNTATYTNLDPGQYLFRFKGKSADGQWIESAKPLKIHIDPPAWRTWWAYLLYILFAAAISYVIQAVCKLREASNNYQQLSLTDTLAGAYNRAGIEKVVQRLFADSKTRSRVCVMIFDIDFFKRVNDERGHNMGDHVIRELVKVTKSVIREEDCFGRWGGEEFILLCSFSNPTGARILAEKIRTKIANHEFDEANHLPITVSIGMAFVKPAEKFEETLSRADKALYMAKSSGRNRSILNEEPATDFGT